MNSMVECEIERRELRHEVRRLQTMNEALIDAGKAVVAERDRLRLIVYGPPGAVTPEDAQTTERAEES